MLSLSLAIHRPCDPVAVLLARLRSIDCEIFNVLRDSGNAMKVVSDAQIRFLDLRREISLLHDQILARETSPDVDPPSSSSSSSSFSGILILNL